MASVYPARGRNAWIVARRPPRPDRPDPDEPRGVFLEEERLASGEIAATGVILLTNRECPWKCLMCDLWKETTTESVPPGSIPRQIGAARRRWPEPWPLQVKLYNSGSFFDPGAIAPDDYPEIARLVSFAGNVVVESHPRLAGARALRLRDLLRGSLEVAMGLETAHPEILSRLNKGFDLDEFRKAAAFLRGEGIAVRAFVLVQPPFLDPADGLEWAVRSADFAFSCGAGAVSLIPTRAGNGAMEALMASGDFHPPTLADLERAQSGALALGGGRVFADTWGVEGFSTCPRCVEARLERLRRINRAQRDEPALLCAACGGA
jgi:radical SAM enzyme (TIGR01210 family)